MSRTARLGDAIEIASSTLLIETAVALSPARVLHVAYQRKSDANIEVARLEGGTFVPLGPVVNERTANDSLDMAIDSAGVVYVALVQRDANATFAEVVVRRFDAANATWQTVGTPFSTNNATLANTGWPRLAVDAGNRPVLTFVRNASFDLLAYRFDGQNWLPLGAAASFVLSPASLAIDTVGNPVVAYVQRFSCCASARLDVSRYDGTTWSLLGSAVTVDNANQLLGQPPGLAIAPDGNPWVAWHSTLAPQVQVAAFDGTAFVALPQSPVESVNGVAALTFLGSDAVVGGMRFQGQKNVQLSRFKAGAWETPAAYSGGSPTSLQLVGDVDSVISLEVSNRGGIFLGATRVAFP